MNGESDGSHSSCREGNTNEIFPLQGPTPSVWFAYGGPCGASS